MQIAMRQLTVPIIVIPVMRQVHRNRMMKFHIRLIGLCRFGQPGFPPSVQIGKNTTAFNIANWKTYVRLSHRTACSYGNTTLVRVVHCTIKMIYHTVMLHNITFMRKKFITSPAPKRRGRRTAVVAAVVAAILVVAGVGMWVWHEQPSFCGAICHTPMDNYLTTYESDLNSPATDKWGNEVADPRTMLAAYHGKLGNDCMDCHVPTLSEQIGESRQLGGANAAHNQ